MKRLIVLLSAGVVFSVACGLYAQTTKTNNIFAQQLVDMAMSKHPELHLMGLHSTPPGSKQSVIVACSNKSKVGKKSDPDDLEVMHTGKAAVEEKPDRQIFDLGLPLLDKKGTTIGTVVMEINFSSEKTKEGALSRGKQIQSELQKQISSRSKLFQPI
jgi:iron complex outermembrane receptor protein